MNKSTTAIPKKRKGPAPTGKGTPVMVRIQPELLFIVDQFRREESDLPSRPEAIRRLLKNQLISLGHLLVEPG